MKHRGSIKLASLVMTLGLVAAACGGGGGAEDGGGGAGAAQEEQLQEGGTLKIANEGDVDFMDARAAYTVTSFQLNRGVLRTLITYPATPNTEEQVKPVPDLAEGLGEANSDFTQFTYTLKDGVRFGPELGNKDVQGVTGEEITSEDVKYTMESLFNPSVGAQYNFYYNIIEGVDEYSAGKADEISGIETPDDKTIVFNLTEPAADWDLRMSMPATAPVPQSYAEKFDKAKESQYDQHVVATGPYVVSEWTPEEQIYLVRNPEWDPATDPNRKAYVNEVNWKEGFENDVAVQKVMDSDYDYTGDTEPVGPQLQQIVQDPELRRRFINEPEACTYYMTLNVELEPFDDIKVREAVNFAIDRQNLLKIHGGEYEGDVATSILPQNMAGSLSPEEFNPFQTPNMAGDIDKAKQLMADAGYPNGYDKPILMVGSSDDPGPKAFESMRADLEALGFSNIETKLLPYPNYYTQYYQVPNKTHIGAAPGWCEDYADAFTFFDPLFNGENLTPKNNLSNYSQIDNPRLNSMIEQASQEPVGPERTAAWEEVNRLATELAPWVPTRWGNSKIVISDRLLNAYYHSYYAGLDYPNLALEQ